ncbi:gas vesicle protein [Streptomyces beigongshangae]|uniref:gas vesicle protein n=1 Tax=Streptomyces beigongshangae TaxID=2841597 RepID=UPI0027E1CDE1|nr:gas vesicle protein GvpJ [Streptomyces sp. REN17]
MTLDDLVEVLLNKGAVLHLDLIVAVADIPLIGVSIRAAIAGMETMLEYGMMRNWDEATRAWAERSTARRAIDLRENESLVCRMSGGHLLAEGVCTGWRPGTVYLTDRRLVVLREEPRETLWQAELDTVRAVRLDPERTVGGEERLRLQVALADGQEVRLSAQDPGKLHDLVTAACGGRLRAPFPASSVTDEQPLVEGHLWYQESRRGEPLWRGGQGRLTAGRLTWKSPVDSRPALALATADITEVRLSAERSPAGNGRVLVLRTATRGEVRLTADGLGPWTEGLTAVLPDTGTGTAAGAAAGTTAAGTAT